MHSCMQDRPLNHCSDVQERTQGWHACRYRKASAQIFCIFRAFFPTVVIEKASIDEAYLGALQLHARLHAWDC